jgi:disulfide bond formation protein DsbB
MHAPVGRSERPQGQAPAIVLLVSGVLLLGALGFQFLGGLAPCPMCHWQRWAHLAAVLVAGLALFTGNRTLALLAILGLAVAGGLGAYHAGVEQGWWPSPVGCAAQVTTAGSAEDFLGQLMQAPVVRCDQIPWSLLGISMAGWNALVSFAGATLALWRWRIA